MSRVIMVSQKFPAIHPKAGEPTYFVEQILNSIKFDIYNEVQLISANSNQLSENRINTHELAIFVNSLIKSVTTEKHHTIRVGNRWKVGDKFSPRVWSDKPYRSPQIIIAPDIEIVKVWDVEIAIGIEGININGQWYFEGYDILLQLLAKNDGLKVEDFKSWFNKPFKGQIICWNKNIPY